MSSPRSSHPEPDTVLSLYRISQTASSVTTERDAYRVIMAELQRLFQPVAASISLISPDTGLLEKEYALGYPSYLKELSLHLGKGVTGRVAFIGEPMLVKDLEAESVYVKLIEGVRCKIAVPMIVGGQIIGTIDVDSSEPGGYDDSDLERLRLVSDEASRSLQSLWRQKQLKNNSEQLNALFELGQNLVSKLELQGLWERISETALHLTGGGVATLQLYREDSQTVALQALAPATVDWANSSKEVPREESLSSPAIKTGRQVEFIDITTPDFKYLRDLPRDRNLTSCLSTPMVYEGKIIGVLNIFTRGRHRFPNDDRRLVQAFANLSAVSAENAALYARAFNSEDKLRKSERLTTLGLLSAEIAHEIRNPLTVIKLLFGALGLEYSEGDPRRKDTHVIKEKINQLEEIVGRVLSFGKAPESLHSHWSVDELMLDTLLLVRLKTQQQGVVLNYEIDDKTLKVDGNKGQLQQVFLNLILNAAEAMPEGGTLGISIQREDTEIRPVVAIYFKDTGSGIDPGIQERIFDSFLTSHPEGTGLGLSIVKRILKSHNGDIDVAATSDSGTTMRVEIPAV